MSDHPLLSSLQRWKQMPRLRWFCRCAEYTGAFTETSLEELPAACHPLFSTGCASDSLLHRSQDVSILRGPLPLVSYSSSWFRCIIYLFIFCFSFLAPLSSLIPTIYAFIYLFILVSSSIWFCFPARSCGELCVWLKCVDWCCCGETPFSSATTSH